MVSDKKILNLIKSKKVNSWDELLERSGYEDMKLLKKRVRRIHYKCIYQNKE